MLRLLMPRLIAWCGQKTEPDDEIFPLRCSQCRAEMRIIAFITEAMLALRFLWIVELHSCGLGLAKV
jgi:hypothetical protein